MTDDFTAVFEKLDAYFAHDDTFDTMCDSLPQLIDNDDGIIKSWFAEQDRLGGAVAQAFYEATADRNPSDCVKYLKVQDVARMAGYTRTPK